jgi:hypothetical protein
MYQGPIPSAVRARDENSKAKKRGKKLDVVYPTEVNQNLRVPLRLRSICERVDWRSIIVEESESIARIEEDDE